jgi:hypothetical protein
MQQPQPIDAAAAAAFISDFKLSGSGRKRRCCLKKMLMMSLLLSWIAAFYYDVDYFERQEK